MTPDIQSKTVHPVDDVCDGPIMRMCGAGPCSVWPLFENMKTLECFVASDPLTQTPFHYRGFFIWFATATCRLQDW